MKIKEQKREEMKRKGKRKRKISASRMHRGKIRSVKMRVEVGQVVRRSAYAIYVYVSTNEERCYKLDRKMTCISCSWTYRSSRNKSYKDNDIWKSIGRFLYRNVIANINFLRIFNKFVGTVN